MTSEAITRDHPRYDMGGFQEEISGIRSYTDPNQIILKSRDYYWYSPLLRAELDDCAGDIVVIPQDQDEVRRVVAAAAKRRIPVTVRGGGTGNYGQCVPLERGVILDMTRLDRILSVEPGRIRVEAGARIGRVDDTAHETDQELLMYPSTRRIATVGGFLCGGSGGVGSLRHGVLREEGNVKSVKVMTLEPEPAIVELHGPDILKVQHAYGTNGVVLEVELALTTRTNWIHTAILLDGYDRALRFALEAQRQGLDCYLLTPVDRRFSRFYTKLGDLFPPSRDAVFAMVAPDEQERFNRLAAEYGGTVSFAMTKPDLLAAGLQPAYECGWNHTTLMALRAEKDWTYLQIGYPRPFDCDLVLRQMERYGDDLYMHHEMALERGEIQIIALPLVKYRGRDALEKMMRELEEIDGCQIFNPHVYTIEDGGMKTIDFAQIDFKRMADPYGLMNPGKTRGWSSDMARSS